MKKPTIGNAYGNLTSSRIPGMLMAVPKPKAIKRGRKAPKINMQPRQPKIT